MDFLFLNLYLGIVAYSIGSILFVVLIKKVTNNRRLIGLLLALQFVFSFILSILFWRHWLFDIDIMFGFILLPSAFGETISIVLFCMAVPWIFKQIKRNKS